MRSTPLQLSAVLLSVFLIAACHKSTTKTTSTGYVGHWQITQLNGGPFIDVMPVDRDHVFELKLLADSTRQDILNGKVISAGTWSVRSKDSAGMKFDLLVYGDSLGSSYFIYQASVSQTQLVLKMYPDVGYKAVYERK